MSRAAAGAAPVSETSLVGVLGGTFDPVHRAHLRLAVELRAALSLGEVLLMPAPNPRLRGVPHASPGARLEMLERALAGERGLRVDAREIGRPGPTSTVETFEQMRRERPDRTLCLILGMDAFARLEQWRRWRELFALAHLAVAARPGAGIAGGGALGEEVRRRLTEDPATLHREPAGRVFLCTPPPLDISASEIRAQVARGEPVDGLVPEAVARYIAERRLYVRPD